ncbi:hypothetical protein MKCMC460_12260 [Mycobacterium sp. 20KCMC460]|uniref:Uncharacterized protein n=1 Tax=Mycobacterium kiyosense TaxID=2871094 RepID=A0A9P3Q4N9_9MYCO|nr:hypothetical protein MKCMC460_12260 [Mycobacterium sp. 20KCMC460]GLB85542.1 hypothetical protein SRL2020028_47980 [Mycobacterium kiyosense]GLC01929.1 hypothetical protein SRL2020400_25200 [Mycobacterium kiyosense]GLC12834.1 hypothetical protein SRL2020448_14370 [Mycobacterium kiyosense]GLD04993.1 hypothetical protein Mkiyose1383_13190 [Mycobacterium kiyosense]
MRVKATRRVVSLIPKSAVSLINSLALAHAGWAPSKTLSTTDRAVIFRMAYTWDACRP